MEESVLSKVVLPAALFIVMLGMGIGLVPKDFTRVMKEPKAFVVGIACQMLLLPLIGVVVVKLFGLSGALAVGLMVLAFSPGGTTSNMISLLAKGDVALSISLTAIVSLVAPFTIPFLTQYSMNQLMGEAQAVHLPLGKTIAQLLVITIIPVGIGMFVRRRNAEFAASTERPLRIASVVILFLVIAGLVKQQWAELPGFFAATGTAALTLNVVSMGLGFGIAQLAKLERKQSITVGIEVGIQNGTTALLVTATILKNPTMAIAPAIYSLIMFGTGAVFGILVNMGRKTDAARA